MKAIYTIQNFAKRFAMVLAIGLMAINTWGATYNSVGTTLTSGKSYIIVAGGKYAITASNPSSGYIGETDVESSISGSVLTTTATNIVWVATVNASSQWTFKNGNSYINNNSGTSYRNMSYGTGGSTTYTISSNKIYSTGDASKWLQRLSGGNFRMYNSTQSGASETFVFYELEESCAKSVTVSNGGSSTNGTITSITTSPVATCSATATDRQVSIVVTPSTGYDAPENLSVGSSTGTVTSTKVSRTNNNNGTFTFVYRYNQNDNGTISYNAACVAKTYTITLNNQDPTTASTPTSITATYNSSTGLTGTVVTTRPTKTGYTFGGYYTGTEGSGVQLINSDGEIIASASGGGKTYTDASKNWVHSGNVTVYAKWTERPLTNYRTTCCTELTTVSGKISVGSINETGGTATWSWSGATTGISKNILKIYNTSDVLVKTIDNISASATSQSITDLTPCTEYYATLTTVASSGYCDGAEQGKSDNFTTNGWAVHYEGGDENEGALLSNVTKTSGDAQACLSENYVATFTANTGYELPTTITVYIASSEVDVDEAYTWSISDGVGTLTVYTSELSEEIDVRIIGEPKTYTASNNLDKNGGDANGQYTATYNATSIAINTTPTRAGYTVEGYYKEEGCTNKVATAAGVLQANKTYTDGSGKWIYTSAPTLFTKWTETTHTVNVASGGNGNVSPASVSGVGITTASGDITATPNTGYHFVNWTLPSGVTAASTYSATSNPIHINATADGKTITANFAINQHTITWKSEDGTSTLETDASQNYGTATTFDGSAPTKATTASYTYTFDGWTTAANGGGTFYANGSTPTVSGDATYYAHFSATANVASVTVGGATTYYTTLAGAMGDAMLSDNSTIKILDDISGQPALTYNVAKKCTLDLNNHTVAGTVTKLLTINNASANFTITDNSVAKGGVLKTVVSSNARVYCLYLTAGTVNMENGKVYCQNTYTYNSSSAKNVAASAVYVTASQTFTMNNGTLESEAQYGSYALYIAQGTSTVTVNGGLIKGYTNKSTTASGIYNLAKGLTINNGHIIGHSYTSTSYGLYLHGGHAIVNGGTIEATNDTTSSKGTTTAYGIYVAYKSSSYRGILTIPSSSTVNVLAKARTTTASAVTVGGSSTGSTIAGGTFTAWTKTSTTAYGVYSSGNITISGGTFNVNSKTTTAYGIYATRGTTTVNSTPTFNVKAGSTTACGALASGTVGKAGTGKYSGTITINGGTFNVTSTTTTAYGVQAGLYARTVSIADDKAEPNDTILGQHYMPGTINVTDGIFNVKATKNTAYGIYVDGKNTESGEAGTTVRIPKATITGGKFKITSAGDATLAYAMNTAADNTDLVVQGGYYSTKKTDSGNIEDKYTATGKSCNYHVFTPSGVAGYDYKVAEGYTLTWNLNGGTVTTAGTGAAVDATGTPSIVVEKGASITAPTVTKTGYTFSSWSPSVPAAMPAANTTYAATWTANTITITWNPNGEGASVSPTSSSYTYDGSTVTLPTPTRPLSVFTGWYTDASGDTQITEVGTTNKPLEDVTYYAHWRALTFEVKDQAGTGTADIHLTSTRGVTVYATSGCGNLITIKADNLDAISNLGGGTANKQNIQIKYLDANNGDAEVAKASSPFRLCNNGSSNYNNADGSNINLNGLTNYSQTYSISYTPSEYGKIDHYKLQLRLQNNNTNAITITFDLYGRSLPDEFVIATKSGSKWYALPNNLAGTEGAQNSIVPVEISVDNTSNPTRATSVPSTVLYRATDRYTAANKSGIRFTNDGSHWLQTSSTATTYKMWLSGSGGTNAQDWYLKSSNFEAYEVMMDPIGRPSDTRRIERYDSYIGYHGSRTGTGNIYFLSTGQEYEAEVQAWTEHDMLVELESSITSNGVTATLDGTTVTGTATGSGTTYIVHTAGLNYAGKSGKELVIRWKNNSTILGTTKIEMPNVIALSAGNWPTSSAPTIDDYVVLKGATTVTVTNAKAKDVVLDKSDGNSGTLTINAGKELVVNQKVHMFNGSSFVATGADDLVFGSTSALGLGALVMGNHDGTNKATVNFYTRSKGDKHDNTSVGQYVGTPFSDETNILYNWYNSWVYKIIYNSGVMAWDRVNEGQGMDPFKGYCVFSADAWDNGEGHSYWMQGTLVSSANHTCSGLNWQSGTGTANLNNENLLANSWMAPIKIKAMQTSDFTNAEATIYIFNSTSYSGYSSLGGNYDTYTVNVSEAVIPAMQSFSVFTKGSSASVTLDYNRIVYAPALAGTATPIANKAPQRAGASEDEADKMRLFVRTEDGYGDMLYMWEREDFEEGFENGWDGHKLFGESYAPQLYAITPDGEMAVNCVPSWEGTVLGFKKGTEDNVYTFTFEYEGENTWYLNDLKTEQSTRILSGNTYMFSTASGDSEARFIISQTPIHSTPTGIEQSAISGQKSAVKKIVIDDHVYIIRNGKMYSAEGVMVR